MNLSGEQTLILFDFSVSNVWPFKYEGVGCPTP